MKELSSFRRDMLFAVAGHEPASSSDIRGELEDLGYSISTGRLYNSLSDLVDAGLLRKESNGRANVYYVSEDGADALLNRRNWEEQAIQNV